MKTDIRTYYNRSPLGLPRAALSLERGDALPDALTVSWQNPAFARPTNLTIEAKDWKLGRLDEAMLAHMANQGYALEIYEHTFDTESTVPGWAPTRSSFVPHNQIKIKRP